MKLLLLHYLLFMTSCQKNIGVSSFWIEENNKYDGNIKSIHSALISISKKINNTQIDLALRGLVKPDGNRNVLLKDHLFMTSGKVIYKINWFDSNSLEIELIGNDDSILKKKYNLSK
jgi:hypothetical protein